MQISSTICCIPSACKVLLSQSDEADKDKVAHDQPPLQHFVDDIGKQASSDLMYLWTVGLQLPS